MNDTYLQEFLNDNLGKLEEDDRDDLEKPFDETELEYCFKHIPGNKNPGLDGLPFKVYKTVFPIIKQDYLASQKGRE